MTKVHLCRLTWFNHLVALYYHFVEQTVGCFDCVLDFSFVISFTTDTDWQELLISPALSAIPLPATELACFMVAVALIFFSWFIPEPLMTNSPWKKKRGSRFILIRNQRCYLSVAPWSGRLCVECVVGILRICVNSKYPRPWRKINTAETTIYTNRLAERKGPMRHSIHKDEQIQPVEEWVLLKEDQFRRYDFCPLSLEIANTGDRSDCWLVSRNHSGQV